MKDHKKGMIFGKINIIDLIIIIVLVCGAVFVATKLLDVGGTEKSTTKVKLVFFAAECPAYVVPYTDVGDPVMDGNETITLGTVTGIETGESVSFTTLDDGTFEKGSKEGYVSAYITMEGEGVITGTGIVIGNVRYAVGHSTILYAGLGKYYSVLYAIEPLE